MKIVGFLFSQSDCIISYFHKQYVSILVAF